MSLFQLGQFTLHSGERSAFLINADALTDSDIAALAAVISEEIAFSHVHGVPEGGLRLAKALRPYATTGPLLLVDDVCTSGQSMEEARERWVGRKVIGVVLFARRRPPDWVRAVFTLWGPDQE